MKNTMHMFILLSILCWCMCSNTTNEPGSLVFPGAKGFGIDTSAGKSGKIIRVTNLDAEGPGSLREALNEKGPRIVVFEVGGVIDLNKKGLVIKNPFLTIAGQTAPSPGITIIRGGISIVTHDVFVQHIAVRPGDAGQSRGSGWTPDGIASSGANAYNIVIDHCSVSWAVDENLSASGPRILGPDSTSHRITFSNCIIAEGLNDASHSGPHSKGSLIHDFCQDIAIIGNLYAHNMKRNPYFKAYCTGVIVNNVIYNPGRAAIQLDYVENEWENADCKPENCQVSIVGNVLLHGQDTQSDLALVSRKGSAYMDNNLAFDRNGETAPLTYGRIVELAEKPVWPKELQPLPANNVIDHVLEHAGARPKDRDDVDKRIIKDFWEKKGRIIDSQEDVGGYPDYKPTKRRLEIPDGHVQDWLNKMASEIE